MLILHKPEELQQLWCSYSCCVREICWTAGVRSSFHITQQHTSFMKCLQHRHRPSSREVRYLQLSLGLLVLGLFGRLFSSVLLAGDPLPLHAAQKPFFWKWKGMDSLTLLLRVPRWQSQVGEEGSPEEISGFVICKEQLRSPALCPSP